MPFISQFENLKELNLEDNNITRLPDDMSQMFRNITIINLNGNEFVDYDHAVHALLTIPNLKSLFINLHEEEQVDLVMRLLEDLEELNGLPVERDLIDGEGEETDEAEHQQQSQYDEDDTDGNRDRQSNRYKEQRDLNDQQKRLDLFDGLEEIQEVRRESESKNNSMVLKDE